MSSPYIGEIRMFGGTYAPYGWAFCDGSLISISENDALYNLIGTTYGGNGISTFGLPNLLGRLPIHAGTGQGTQTYILGQLGGLETVTLNTNQLPSHVHTLSASTDTANATTPASNVLLSATGSTKPYHPGSGGVPLNSASVSQVGSSESHDNMMPYLCVNFIIALVGVYPPQS
jgi:microcystin-dependent protein